MSEQNQEKILTVKEAAAKENVHRNTIRRWIDEHGLEAEQVGPKTTRIPATALEEFKKKFKK